MKTKFRNSLKELTSVKSLTLAGMLLALIVVMGFYANFSLAVFPLVKLSFSFLPRAIGAMMLGPAVSGMISGLGDLLSFFLNPQGGVYFPGWTLNAILTGVIFGIFLYKNKATLKNIVLAQLTSLVFVEMILGTLWLTIQFGFPYFETFITRGITNSLAAPFEIAIMFVLGKVLVKIIPHTMK